MIGDYLKPTNLNDEVTCRFNELAERKQVLEKRLGKYPAGKLHIVNSNGRVQYYLRMSPGDKSGEYISKSDKKRLRVFAQKKYDEEIIKLLDKEICEIEKILKRFERGGRLFSEQVKEVFSNYPIETREYINPLDIPDDEYILQWSAEEYRKKTIDETVPRYETLNGEKVRSKSELNIANLLYKYGIPYKYEYPFELKNGRTVYPDFAVLNIRKRKVIFWEHRGMMDDRDYSKNAVFKNKEYMKSGLILGNNLVISEETSMMPLGTDEIEMIIRNYFL